MPYRYTPTDYLNMSICYHMGGENMNEARRLFEAQYGRSPNERTILGAVQRFRESGTFTPRLETGRPRQHPPAVDEAVLSFFAEHPMASLKEAAASLHVHPSYVWQLLRDEGLHPYHFTRVQELASTDFAPRVEFCRWLTRRPSRHILWTDECTFSRVGMFNHRNTHYWAAENPHVVRPDHFQRRFSVNVWGGLIEGSLLGPIFLERLNGDSYLQFLQEQLPDLLAEVPLSDRRQMWFQQDGAPAHFQTRVRDYLDMRFMDRWIGRGGAVGWPPRSPDLTPMDFHVWGRVKDLVYRHDGHTIANVEDLKVRICDAFARVNSDSDTLMRVKRHCLRRASLCIEHGGGYVQQNV